MLVWIVNPFDPLPGDPEQEGRYATLARLLVARGHQVTWWTSSFSHRFKRPVDQEAICAACNHAGIGVEFLATSPYYRNVGLRRVWNHAQLARRFRRAAAGYAERPDVVVVSSPPPVLAGTAVEIAHRLGAQALLDVQDWWPDAFAGPLPAVLRPLLRPAFCTMRRHVRRSSAACDAIVGVADAYVESALRAAGECPRKPSAMIPLGVDLKTFDAGARAGRCDRLTKPHGEIWLAYTGSLNQAYDFQTILRAAASIGPRYGRRLRFFLTGRGELGGEAQRFVQEQQLTHVTLTGFLEFNPWAYLVTQCDIGFNAVRPDVMIYLPNKIFYYLAAGAAVLNTIPGQCSRIVRDGGCGLDYEAGNVSSCVNAIEAIVRDDARLRAMRQAARRLAESTYDRAVLFPKYADFIEQLGARASAR